MSEPSPMSPSEKRAARDAARKGDRDRRSAIGHAMRAGWAGDDADEANWLDAAAQTYPGPEAATQVLYGIAARLIDQLAEATGQDRDALLTEVLG